MAYSTLSDLVVLIPETKLIKLSNDESGATAVDQNNVAAAIEQADRLIDGYAGLQRSVPLDPVPQVVKILSAQEAVFNLYRRRNQVPDLWNEQHKTNMNFLLKVSEGKISLGSAKKETPAPAQVLAHSSGKKMGGADGLLEKF